MSEVARIPVLIGTSGLAAGECFVLSEGVEIVIGRSRSCDVSLRRSAGYLKTPALVRDNDHDFNTVSRRHLRLTVHAGNATFQDLSSNGTFVNGEQLSASKTVDLNAETVTVRLGTRETFTVSLLPSDDERIRDVQPLSKASAMIEDEG